MNQEVLKKLAAQISDILPDSMRIDAQKNIQDILARQLNKLNIVSRDEFDAQQAVLLRTREKLDGLEQIVKDLEQQLSDK